MKLHAFWVAVALSALSFGALAQDETHKEIIYKWKQGGKTHYAEWPPHGINNYQRLNNQGFVLSEIPDMNSFLVIRPERPAVKPAVAEEGKAQADRPELNTKSQVITREQRCEKARANLRTINEKQTVYEEDGSGNLIPLNPAEVAKRREATQAEIDSVCTEQKPQQQ